MQAALGGSFKDGALAGFASGLGQQVVGSMLDGIKAAVDAGAMTPVQAAAAKTMAVMVGSAIRAAATPGDPGQAFANAFLGDVIGQIDTRPPVTQTAFDDNGYLNPGIVDANASSAEQAAQLAEQLRRQGMPAAQATLMAQRALDNDVGGNAVNEVAQLSQPNLPEALNPNFPDESSTDLAAAPTLDSPDARTLFRDAERVADPGAYLSVPGRPHLATPGQSISSILGTNDPQAIGNFMRANSLVSDTLLIGRAYFVPDSPTAYGNAEGLGQAALNASNARLAQARELAQSQARERQAQQALGSSGLPQTGTGQPLGMFASAPAEPLPDALTQTQRIIQYALVRNSDLNIGAGPEAAPQWTRRAEELLTVALQYKALNKPTDGRPFMSDSIYNGLVADALQARAMAGAGVDRSALEQTARLLIENGEAAQAGAAAAGAAASRLGRAPATAQGTAHSATAEQLRADLSNRSGVQADTSRDADYIARTDPRMAPSNKFDWNHVLAGEVNAAGKATGYHAEGTADGAARIAPGCKITQNSNGTYEAPVQIWSDGAKAWIDKPRESTFFPADWSRARIEFEVTEAFKLKQMVGAQKWQGTSPSGIVIEGYINPNRTTFYPLGKP